MTFLERLFVQLGKESRETRETTCSLTAEKGKEDELKEKLRNMESREDGIKERGDQGKGIKGIGN